jgi:VanZ family protein
MSGGVAAESRESIERTIVKWLPVLVWAIVIFALSSSYFTAANTSRIIDPILRFLMPGASAATIALGHDLVRKSAHFTNYAILFWLLARGPMSGRPYAAFGLCVLYALLDEGHQIFVPGRTPSLWDVALDSTGALFSRFLHSAVSEFA